MSFTELDAAQRIRDGTLPSPVKFNNMWLVNLRITGTGLSYRSGLTEHVWRDPNLYLNDYFLQRCNGLPVVLNHPETVTLTEEDFKERVIGCVMLPYIREDEVWAVCRIYVKEIVDKIADESAREDISTSPAVLLDDQTINVKEGDANFCIEGQPFLIDHIAIVTKEHGGRGVWDKGGPASGVEVTNTGDIDMDEQQMQTLLAKIVGDAMAGFDSQIKSFAARMDSLEQGIQKRADADAEAQKKADEKARADAEEKAKADAAEEEQRKADEAEAQKKADEEKARADAEAEEKAKADAEEKAKADEEAQKKADAELTEAQAKADSAYAACGKKAPTPFSGESPMNYRKRCLEAMQKHSERFKDANIRAIADSVSLSSLEEHIYAEARKVIEAEMASTKGMLYPQVRKDAVGRQITEYRGDMNSWLDNFKMPPARVKKFNNTGSIH